ncbi:MAG TPA: hypothetical protein VGD14_09500 [bacterium]
MKTPRQRQQLWNNLFFKGGSSGESYDAAYNARMATLAETQQDMANQSFDFWKSDYQPMEKAQIAANMEMIPVETAMNVEKMQAERDILPGQVALGKAKNASDLSTINAKAPVTSKFFEQALTGVDVESRASRAAADAITSFKNSDSITRRNASRMGINPNSGAFANAINSNSLNQAKTVAGAMNTARTNAEQENFARLTTAMGYGG